MWSSLVRGVVVGPVPSMPLASHQFHFHRAYGGVSMSIRTGIGATVISEYPGN